uniref:Uncharacterized protein n=1 Tax=Salix viminalis TaxID=40686 RepID=A0A6N2N106_SALVM
MYFAKENAFPHVVLVSRADSISQHHLGSQLSQKAVHALSTPEHSHDHNYYPHTSTPDSKSRITLLPLPTRQSDSDGDFVVVASGGKGERQMDKWILNFQCSIQTLISCGGGGGGGEDKEKAKKESSRLLSLSNE